MHQLVTVVAAAVVGRGRGIVDALVCLSFHFSFSAHPSAHVISNVSKCTSLLTVLLLMQVLLRNVFRRNCVFFFCVWGLFIIIMVIHADDIMRPVFVGWQVATAMRR